MTTAGTEVAVHDFATGMVCSRAELDRMVGDLNNLTHFPVHVSPGSVNVLGKEGGGDKVYASTSFWASIQGIS